MPITMAKVDDKFNVVQSNTFNLSNSRLMHTNRLLEMKDKVFAIYNGYSRVNTQSAIAQEVDLNQLELSGRSITLFEKGDFKVMKKSKNEEFVAFSSDQEVRMYDSNLKLLWKQKLYKYTKTVYIKDMVVSDIGEVFLLIGKVNNESSRQFDWNFNCHVMKVSKGEATISDAINPEAEPFLRDVIFDLDADENVKLMCYTMTMAKDGTAGIFIAKIDSEDLEILSADMLDVSKFISETSKILSITHMQPYYLADGSYYLVGQLHWVDYSGNNRYSTTDVSKISAKDELSWLKYVKKNHYSTPTTTHWSGVVAAIVDDKLHLLSNDVERNRNLGDKSPVEVSSVTSRKQLYEWVFDTSGDMQTNTINLLGLTTKSVLVACDVYGTNNSDNGVPFISFLVPKGIKYKRLYVTW